MQAFGMYVAQEMYWFGWSFGTKTGKHAYVACIETKKLIGNLGNMTFSVHVRKLCSVIYYTTL